MVSRSRKVDRDAPARQSLSGGAPVLLRSLAVRAGAREDKDRFPWSIPAVRTLETLTFRSPVTFLVGENGSGKSTILEAIAAATSLPAIGAELRVDADHSLEAQRQLGASFKLVWERRATRGFFLRAEDFFGFTKTLALMRAEFLRELDEVDAEYEERSAWARTLRAGPIRASLSEMESRYGVDLDANSHGQSFLRLFQSRFVPQGLYLLDEPEAPLSPQSQLGLLAMLKDMVAQEAQFIIATHSPMLLAFPGATIYSFDKLPIASVAFDELEHVALTREFLADPDRFLRRL